MVAEANCQNRNWSPSVSWAISLVMPACMCRDLHVANDWKLEAGLLRVPMDAWEVQNWWE